MVNISDSCNPSSHILPYPLHHLILSHIIFHNGKRRWLSGSDRSIPSSSTSSLGTLEQVEIAVRGVQPIIKRHNLQCNVPNCLYTCNHKCKDNYQTSETTTRCSKNIRCLLHKNMIIFRALCQIHQKILASVTGQAPRPHPAMPGFLKLLVQLPLPK